MTAKSRAIQKAEVAVTIKVNGNKEITPPKDKALRDTQIDSALNVVDGGMVIQAETGYSTAITVTDPKAFVPLGQVEGLIPVIGDFLPLDGSLPMGGPLNMDGNNIVSITNLFDGNLTQVLKADVIGPQRRALFDVSGSNIVDFASVANGFGIINSAGIRTYLIGLASGSNKTISFPDANGTVALLSDIPLTTKGDVLTYSTVNARLGVGANGTVLMADSATVTGLKWAAVSGTGTVTSVSVTTAAGVSGSVANSTTTPAITITLGVITPTSVNGQTFAVASTRVAGGVSILAGAANTRNTAYGHTIQQGQFDTTLFGNAVNSNSSSVRVVAFGAKLNAAVFGGSNNFMFGTDQVLYSGATKLLLLGSFITVTSQNNIILNPSNTVDVTYAGGSNVIIGCNIPAYSNAFGTMVGDSVSIVGVGVNNATVLGRSAAANIDATFGVTGGDCLAAGAFSVAGSWRTTAVGPYSRALSVSATVLGHSAFSNVTHGLSLGRGAYGVRIGTTFSNGGTGGSNIFLDDNGSSWTNPTIPETVDESTALNNGTWITRLYGKPGVDLKPVTTLTNTRGGHLRSIGGPSTGTAFGGNYEIAVTPGLNASGNVENTEVVGFRMEATATSVSLSIGTAPTQLIGLYGATAIVQPTTAFASATVVINAGTAINDATTFDGYTIAQLIKIVRTRGDLA